jgi:hypothetical protein
MMVSVWQTAAAMTLSWTPMVQALEPTTS